jgi:hypothetical protein
MALNALMVLACSAQVALQALPHASVKRSPDKHSGGMLVLMLVECELVDVIINVPRASRI